MVQRETCGSKQNQATESANLTSVSKATATEGDQTGQLWQQLYDELHDIAAGYMRREAKGNLLQTTFVLHEAYLRLKDYPEWSDRNSFLKAASVTMRRVLIDSARKRSSEKRGGGRQRIPLADAHLSVGGNQFVFHEIHDALQRLGEFAPDESQILEMMVFGGMTGDEIADALGVSASTIDRRLRVAKTWLRRELSP
jgi:RNA polymerase sigma factor (TIGR02999 family)